MRQSSKIICFLRERYVLKDRRYRKAENSVERNGDRTLNIGLASRFGDLGSLKLAERSQFPIGTVISVPPALLALGD